MKKFDVYFTVLEVEHATVSAENEEEAKNKTWDFVNHLVDEGMLDPVEVMSSSIDIRPVEYRLLEGLE